MHLGEIEVRHIHGGNFYLDGGAMFGVVPKPLWEKKSSPDTHNGIRLAANSLLVRAANHTILVETGNGTKWTPKLRHIYGLQEGDPLVESLAASGVRPDQVNLVINTHLHFDHAGGNTKLSDRQAVPTFSNACYIVQAGELDHAANPPERDRASYFDENFLPLKQSGQWTAISGDTEILPGISTLRATTFPSRGSWPTTFTLCRRSKPSENGYKQLSGTAGSLFSATTRMFPRRRCTSGTIGQHSNP
jgi:glyoxylase-like metal-dependent hydrolase (beta-lactamase superfamily II)